MTDRLRASFQFCRALTRRTAGNFGYAFWALPGEQRWAMDALYAFMRMTDDIGDDPRCELPQRMEQLSTWKQDLQSALRGQLPDHPIWPAVAYIVDTYGIPEKLLTDVIDGVAMDLAPRPFGTFAELSEYCYHVAGAVGLCCIRIWGYRNPIEAEAAAIDCGLAFQLTNILRDLGEDAAQDRVYLPQKDFVQFAYNLDDLRAHRITREFRNLMAFETERAWMYYRRAERLMTDLEPPGRPVLRAMLEIYGGLLREIESREFDVFSRRISLPVWRKVWITGKAIWGAQ